MRPMSLGGLHSVSRARIAPPSSGAASPATSSTSSALRLVFDITSALTLHSEPAAHSASPSCSIPCSYPYFPHCQSAHCLPSDHSRLLLFYLTTNCQPVTFTPLPYLT